jgi:P27 family predicted phage terminase small subunit
MAGRRPKATALKILEGNPGKRPLNEFEPQPKKGSPVAPAFLTDSARAEWDRIVPQLEEIGVLTQIDGTALASYCQAYARWIEAEAAITKYGIVIVEPIMDNIGEHVGDKIRKNPACTAAMAFQRELRALISVFGLDPSSRTRLKSEGQEEKLSPLAQLLKERSDHRAQQRA